MSGNAPEPAKPRRRVRLWAILWMLLLILCLTAFAVSWLEKDLILSSSRHRLQAYISGKGGVEFHVEDFRPRFFPPRVSLGAVTVYRRGEPWALTAEGADLSTGFYALIFRRGGVGKISLQRPRFFLRKRSQTSDTAGGGPSVPSVLMGALPFRNWRITDGELLIVGSDGSQLTVDGLDFDGMLSGEQVLGRLDFRRGSLRRDDRFWELGETSSDWRLSGSGVEIKNVKTDGKMLEGELRGSVGITGDIDLEGTLAGRLERLAPLFGMKEPLSGRAAFSGEVKGSYREPLVSGRISLDAARFMNEPVPDLRGSLFYRDRRLEWSGLRAVVGDGEILSTGIVDFAGERPKYTLEIHGEEIVGEDLPALFPGIPETVRVAAANVSWSGEGFDRDRLEGDGTVEARLTLDQWKAGEIAISAEGGFHEGSLFVNTLEATSGGARIRTVGGGYRVEELSDGVKVRGSVDDISAFLDSWGIEGYGGRLSFHGKVAPTERGGGFRFTGPLRLRRGAAFGLTGLSLGGLVSIDSDEVKGEEFKFRADGARGTLSGSAGLRSRRLDALLELNTLSIERITALTTAGSALTGVLNGRVLIKGTVDAPRLQGKFAGSRIEYGEVMINDAAGEFSYTDEVFSLKRLTLERGDSKVILAGDIHRGRNLSGTVESELFNFRDFHPRLNVDMAASVEGRIGGTVKSPEIEGRLATERIVYGGLELKESEMDFGYSEGKLALDGFLLGPENRFRSVFTVTEEGWPFEADILLERFSPQVVRGSYPALSPVLAEALEGMSFLSSGKITASGQLRDPESMRGELVMETLWLHSEGQALQNTAPIIIRWEEGSLAIKDFQLAGEEYRLKVSGKGGTKEGWDLAFQGQVNLSLFQDYWDELETVDSPGEVELTLTGPWEKPRPAGQVSFRGGSIKVRVLPDPISELDGFAELNDGIVTVSRLSGKMGEGNFTGEGRIDLDMGEIDAAMEGRLDLALFKERFPTARAMSGPVTARLKLKGPVNHPRITGEVLLDDGELFIQPLPQKISHIRGKILLSEDGAELSGLKADMGGGSLGLNGSVDWARVPAEVDLRLDGKGILVNLEGTVKAQVDAGLALAGNLDSLALRGEVDVVKARYVRDFGGKGPTLPGSGDGGTGGGGPDLSGMALDLTVRAADSVWIANSIAQAENALDLHFGGTVADPEVSGEIRLISGEVVYLARRFKLVSGRINFPPDTNKPMVEAQADINVGSTRIILLLDGPLTRPTLLLTSQPPHSKEDLYALLTVGYTRSDLEEQEDQALAIGAAIFFTGPVIQQLGEGARDAVGLEYFQIEPSFEDAGGAARITLGTSLSDRLFISYSQSLGATEEQQVEMEYQILDYLSLLGRDLRHGLYSLDLVFSFPFD